jgi:hypothetical protein
VEILNHSRRRSRSHSALGIAALGLLVTLENCFAADSPQDPADEYQVKAAFLYNFAKFVEWPPEAFKKSDEPITICILGLDPFGHSLEKTLAGRSVDGRSLAVSHISNVKQAAGCQMLFIGAAEDKRSPPILDGIVTPGVLTIGESDTSGADGVIINMRLDSGKVRFDINLAAADREKLKISSRLLSLAHIVGASGK